MLKFHCPHCDVRISAESDQAGQASQCPACGHKIVVPNTDTPTSATGVQPPPLPPSNQPPALPPPTTPAPQAALTFTSLKNCLNHPTIQAGLGKAKGTQVQAHHLIAGVGALVVFLIIVGSLMWGSSRSEQHSGVTIYSGGSDYNYGSGNPGTNSSQEARTKVCSHCGGSGLAPSGVTITCMRCRGNGTITSPSGYTVVCTTCEGSGRVPAPCSYCKGNEAVMRELTRGR